MAGHGSTGAPSVKWKRGEISCERRILLMAIVTIAVAVRATEVLDLKALKVNECGTARQSVMIGGMYCCIHKPILPCF